MEKERKGQGRIDWSSERRMKVSKQYAACYIFLWGLSLFFFSFFFSFFLFKISCTELQSRAAKLPNPGNHILFVFAWLRATRPTPQTLGAIGGSSFGTWYRQEGTRLPGALPDPQWEETRVGLQLCEAQNHCLGVAFFLLSRRKSLIQKSNVTAVGTGVILDVP